MTVSLTIICLNVNIRGILKRGDVEPRVKYVIIDRVTIHFHPHFQTKLIIFSNNACIVFQVDNDVSRV